MKRKGVVAKRPKTMSTGAAMAKAPTVNVKKQQPWPFKSEDGPVALALDHIDALALRIRDGKVKKFDADLIAQLCKLSTVDLKDLIGHLKVTIEGLKGAVAGDAFLVECHSHFTKPQLKIALEYYKAIAQLKSDGKATDKIRIRRVVTRKAKEKSPEDLTKKVLFLDKDKETGITGQRPAVILGATELWVYNTKTRKLGCYYAMSPDGLSVKGTTILNYDEKKSTTKTIRHPEKQVRDFNLGRIEWSRQYWKAIKSVPQTISPRLSRETLILRVTKPKPLS